MTVRKTTQKRVCGWGEESQLFCHHHLLGQRDFSSSSQNFCVSRSWQLFRSKPNKFETKIVSILIVYTKYILRLIRWEWLMFLFLFFFLMKRNYIILNLHNFFIDTDQNAPFFLFTYLGLTQFSYTEIGNFHDDFMSLNRIHNFDTRRFAISQQFLLLIE